MSGGQVIAIVGAESTGKSMLAIALAARIGVETSLRCAVVGEFLREWCDTHGRTPRAGEQKGIALEQQRRVDEAAAQNEVVVADTMPLLIAVYSQMLFDDASLVPMAIAAQRDAALTLLTALDLPWIADGHQRDGEHVREPVDRLLRDLLLKHRIDGRWSADRAMHASTTPSMPQRRCSQGSHRRAPASLPAWLHATPRCRPGAGFAKSATCPIASTRLCAQRKAADQGFGLALIARPLTTAAGRDQP